MSSTVSPKLASVLCTYLDALATVLWDRSHCEPGGGGGDGGAPPSPSFTLFGQGHLGGAMRTHRERTPQAESVRVLVRFADELREEYVEARSDASGPMRHVSHAAWNAFSAPLYDCNDEPVDAQIAAAEPRRLFCSCPSSACRTLGDFVQADLEHQLCKSSPTLRQVTPCYRRLLHVGAPGLSVADVRLALADTGVLVRLPALGADAEEAEGADAGGVPSYRLVYLRDALIRDVDDAAFHEAMRRCEAAGLAEARLFAQPWARELLRVFFECTHVALSMPISPMLATHHDAASCVQPIFHAAMIYVFIICDRTGGCRGLARSSLPRRAFSFGIAGRRVVERLAASPSGRHPAQIEQALAGALHAALCELLDTLPELRHPDRALRPASHLAPAPSPRKRPRPRPRQPPPLPHSCSSSLSPASASASPCSSSCSSCVPAPTAARRGTLEYGCKVPPSLTSAAASLPSASSPAPPTPHTPHTPPESPLGVDHFLAPEAAWPTRAAK
jgi:hypothetical protein